MREQVTGVETRPVRRYFGEIPCGVLRGISHTDARAHGPERQSAYESVGIDGFWGSTGLPGSACWLILLALRSDRSGETPDRRVVEPASKMKILDAGSLSTLCAAGAARASYRVRPRARGGPARG
jgi:hypothetical protein